MIDGRVNKRSGVLVVNLSTTGCTHFNAPHPGEKDAVYPENSTWVTIDDRAEYERRYPYVPDRIIDNLLTRIALVSVTNWTKLEENVEHLKFLIDAAFNDKAKCEYDLSRQMSNFAGTMTC